MGTVLVIICNFNFDDVATGTCGAYIACVAFHTISNNGCCCSAVAVANGKSMGTIIIIGYRYCRALTIFRCCDVRHINLNCTIRIILNYSIGTIHNICVVFNNCFCWST